ncbi:MAG: LysM domain-containing protein [Polyangiales bacterium]|nr:LysM peptidoglycan-binding domain-containing protein [Myxococcales bacterium]MCB9659868.1 LysM peptidoglycan-binding domain-containing protein [Sandaracinaceae bacterium]
MSASALRRVCLVLLAMLLVLGTSSAPTRADELFAHVVRPGDTLASIAQRYYGDPRRESVLVTENGLTTQGGSAIVVGMRLHIPWVRYHTVAAGETWQQLADRYYGDARRAFVIMESNRVTSEQPAEGAELLIPYPLRHITGQGDSVTRVARLYYADSVAGTRRLRRFNGIRGSRLTRGQVVLVPLPDLLLSEEGRRLVEESTGTAPSDGAQRERQADIEQQLPVLREHIRRGRFTEAVVLGAGLLGAASVTSAQALSIHRELGTAYVALDRTDLAVAAFLAALELQPDLELDGLRTSPTVMRALAAARERRAAAAAAAAGQPTAGAPDGGASAPSDAGSP